MVDPQLGDRVRGVLLGQAIGDALGFGTEFMSKADVAKTYPGGLRDYRQLHDRFKPCEQWQAGDWTDDTDLMLCILDSLLDKETVDLGEIAARFREWAFRDGYGMGRTVYAVVRADDYLHNPTAVARRYWEESGQQAAANGAIMRTSVLGVWDWHDADSVRKNAEAVCQLTHADPRCLGSCCALLPALNLPPPTTVAIARLARRFPLPSSRNSPATSLAA